MSDLLELLPAYLGGHLRLTIVALALGIGISVPLGVLATRWRWLERLVLPLASIVQTIPGLALLAGTKSSSSSLAGRRRSAHSARRWPWTRQRPWRHHRSWPITSATV